MKHTRQGVGWGRNEHRPCLLLLRTVREPWVETMGSSVEGISKPPKGWFAHVMETPLPPCPFGILLCPGSRGEKPDKGSSRGYDTQGHSDPVWNEKNNKKGRLTQKKEGWLW